MKYLLIFLTLLGASSAHADLSGGERHEIPLNHHSTLVRVEFALPEWRNGQTVKIVEGCPAELELHNAGFLASTNVRPHVQQTNGRMVLRPGREQHWSWYLKHTAGHTVRNARIEVSFTCIASGVM